MERKSKQISPAETLFLHSDDSEGDISSSEELQNMNSSVFVHLMRLYRVTKIIDRGFRGCSSIATIKTINNIKGKFIYETAPTGKCRGPSHVSPYLPNL